MLGQPAEDFTANLDLVAKGDDADAAERMEEEGAAAEGAGDSADASSPTEEPVT